MDIKVRKSAIIAFHELLQSIRNGEDVLLLRQSDRYAAEVLHTYNERMHDYCDGDDSDVPEPAGPHHIAYCSFLNKLADRFHLADGLEVHGPTVPSEEVRQLMVNMLGAAMERIT